MILSVNDYLKFMTETFVSYIDKPAANKRKRTTSMHHSVFSRWFGILPFALKIFRTKK
ncbi:MAG TPA: YqzE family protein [Bacillota bacterium]|nr:YqzE family protein [Bacillota bacterium]